MIAALSLLRGEADAMICGLEAATNGPAQCLPVIGKRQGVSDLSALSMLISQRGATFFTDTYVSVDPSAREIAR